MKRTRALSVAALIVFLGCMLVFNRRDARNAKEEAVKTIIQIADRSLGQYGNWLQLLKSETYGWDPILNLMCDDFNDDGILEAVVFCGDESSDDPRGIFFLLMSDETMALGMNSWDYYYDMGEIVTLDGIKVIAVKQFSWDSREHIYASYYMLGDSGLKSIHCSQDALFYTDDAGRLCLNDRYGNTYYFYGDDRTHELREYGGVPVREEDFARYDGADVILGRIEEDGYTIESIYWRQNGIININCEGGKGKKNVRAFLQGNHVDALPDAGGGFYADGEVKQSFGGTYEETVMYNEHAEILRQKLKDYSGQPVLNFIYDDFDNDGSYEAVAMCGIKYISNSDFFYGATVYFASDDGVLRIRDYDSRYRSCDTINLDGVKVVVVRRRFSDFGREDVGYYYTVDGNSITELDGSGVADGLFLDDEGRVYMTNPQRYERNAYYFYWDDGLKEYGGTEISAEEFLTYEGAENILLAIRSQGKEITSIYKRNNGIININCYDGFKNENVRVALKDGSVKVSPFHEGSFYMDGSIYPALIEELAVY